MKTIEKIIHRIKKAGERSQIFDTLYYVVDKKNCLSSGNISTVVSFALQRIKNDFKNHMTVPEAMFLLQNFRDYLLLHDFKNLSKFVLNTTKNSKDIVNVFIAIERYPEIYLDPEDDLLNEIFKKINDIDDNALSKSLVYMHNRQLQESIWNSINFSGLKEEFKDFLLDYKNWYYISPKIVLDLYRLLYNGHKIIPNELKINLMFFFSIVEDHEKKELPLIKSIEKLGRSVMDNERDLDQIFIVRSFFHAFKIGTVSDEWMFSEQIKEIVTEADDYLHLYNIGYFYIHENTLTSIAKKYQKPIKWLLRNFTVLDLAEEDTEQLETLTNSPEGEMYIKYLDVKESVDFFEKQRKNIGL